MVHTRRLFALSALLMATHLAVRAQDIDFALTQANELGVLKFCKSKGFVDDAAIDLKGKFVDLAGGADPKAMDAARKKGEDGIHSNMGIDQSIAELSNDYIRVLCESQADLDRAIATRYGISP
ncbi:hypothetical protein G3O06_20900 [Burkholderia sp. Ac-20345]|uniref:hypothetical protein n=1 Tax=Burkholderia sp. Ac-20345 TaxID=2703891 RepID=UPI00197B09E8|nr:hypothetical protein [Burkholderia sp. Ac-20345]MBN3779996.1 hypothetical protein [Burkholderia sp. Ac-20345]